MDKVVLYSGICIILPCLMLCLYLEKRARRIVVSMIGGVLAGLLAYKINRLLGALPSVTNDLLTVGIAPVVEETMKLIPVAVIALIVKKGKRGSAANAFSVGVGFCIVENYLYLYTSVEDGNIFWIISRCIGTGLMHSMSTTLMGLGIFACRKAKKLGALIAVSGYFAAILLHSSYNFMIGRQWLNIVGILMPIIVFAVLFVALKGTELHNFLWETPTEKQNEG